VPIPIEIEIEEEVNGIEQTDSFSLSHSANRAESIGKMSQRIEEPSQRIEEPNKSEVLLIKMSEDGEEEVE
jgi:hypothetical protein